MEVLILLDGKRLEAALVNVPRPRTVTMSVPALRVRQGQPTGEAGEFAVFARPDDQVPVGP
jgi:hypothetical protein